MSDNLWSLVSHSLSANKNRNAWICRQRKGKRIVKYQQIRDAALSLAYDLRSQGIGAGDTVGVTAPNGPEWSVAALATWKVGACLAPVHIGNSEHEIAQQLEAIKPRLMLVHESESNYSHSQAISMEIDQQAVEAEAKLEASSEIDEIAVRIYTSGSTGHPKVVRLSHGNLRSNVLSADDIIEFSPEDRFISLLPYSHAMGLMINLLLPYYEGSTIVSPRAIAATEILDTLAQEKITVMVAVPRLFRNIMLGLEKKFVAGGLPMALYRSFLKAMPLRLRQHLNAPIRNKLGGKITAWVSGGSHLDGRITHYYHQLGLPLRQGYGLTETSPGVCFQSDFDSAVESVGKPLSGVDVKIDNPDQNGCGELWIKGPNVMLGYDDPQQTIDVMVEGWFRSGDIARLDDNGRVTLTGRCKRLIVTEAGKNVYPEELETQLERNPEIKEAAVLEKDMKPVCVVSMDGENAEQRVRDALKQFNSIVSKHNQVTRFAIVDELPRTPLGKLALQQLPQVFDQFEVK